MISKTFWLLKSGAIYSDENDLREKHAELLAEMGLQEHKIGAYDYVLCNSEQAVFLIRQKYCAWWDIDENVMRVEIRESAEDSSSAKFLEACTQLLARSKASFNEVTGSAQPGNLQQFNNVIVLVDCCTDNLQSHLNDGWQLLAIQPQPDQRRPDYVLGRKS